MAKRKNVDDVEVINEIIEPQPLEEVMGDRYATYAKYVIQDRAIPDVRDGLKPVQRRIIYSMFREGNFSTRPTKKCAHTVGAVMGKYHPHGDSSIYEALARMSQDWKVRVPLVDFQGNNGSIDGDQPAAYRYTEARLSEIADEMIRDIDKKTVDMNLTFDDADFEPDVLPARFPNLLVNGSEGIAVALATEIPPHNLAEVCEATIYRMENPDCSVSDLRQFVKGPDFPTGGIIYNSDGLDQIYETGRGKIEVSSKCEIVDNGKFQQIVITEIPYKVVKIQLVHEIDLIRHDKVIDGIDDVRDESDLTGMRIVVDLKKDAKADKVLAYLMKQTELKTNYSANVVAISNGRPKTLSLTSALDAYIEHQKDVITRRCKFDLAKCERRLHIVDGIIIAINNYVEVCKVIQKSKDKSDSKINLQNRFGLSEEQSEAVVMMPLYKLSQTDVNILLNEKTELEAQIAELKEILANPKKLAKVIINDLRAIVKKYGDNRRTQIVDKDEGADVSFNKRDLITAEDVMIAVTRDGYIKRSSIKSYKGSNGELPGVKAEDAIVYQGMANTKDYVVAFTQRGNYLLIPVYEMIEGKWKDEGKHVNYMISFNSNNDKIVKVFVVTKFRSDLYFVFASKRGQIKRTRVSEFFAEKYSRAMVCMKLMNTDELISVCLSSGSSNILLFTADGQSSCYPETALTPVGPKTSGVKSITNMNKTDVAACITFENDQKVKLLLITDCGNVRIFDTTYTPVSKRLSRLFQVFKTFKNERQYLRYVGKIDKKLEKIHIIALNNSNQLVEFDVDDFHITPLDKYASKSTIGLDDATKLVTFYSEDDVIINDDVESRDTYVESLNVEGEENTIDVDNTDVSEDNNNVEETKVVDDTLVIEERDTSIEDETLVGDNLKIVEETTVELVEKAEIKDEEKPVETPATKKKAIDNVINNLESSFLNEDDKKSKKKKLFEQISLFGDDDLD